MNYLLIKRKIQNSQVIHLRDVLNFQLFIEEIVVLGAFDGEEAE